MGKKKSNEKLLNGRYIYLILISCITGFGFNIIYTLVVDYSITNFRVTLSIAGIISGIFSIAALVVRPFAGAATDFLNKKMLCIVSTGVIGFVALGYAFVCNVPCMFVLRILHGAAFGISSTVNIALVCSCIPKSRLAEGLGYYGLGQVFAQTVGPGIGAAIQAQYGYRFLFILIFALNTIAVLGLTRIDFGPMEKTVPGKSFLASFAPKNLIAADVLMYAAIGGLFSLSNGIVNSFLRTFCASRNIPGYALFFTVSAIVLLIIRFTVGRIADQKGVTGIVNFSLIISAAAMICLSKSFCLAMLLVAAVLKAAGQGGGQISLQAECIKSVDESRSGVASSTFFIGADIGQGLGPVIGGAFTTAYGYNSTFMCTGLIFLIGLIAFNFYQRRRKQQQNISPII